MTIKIECQVCQDSGFYYVEDKPYKCECVIRKEIKTYLTPQYLDAIHSINYVKLFQDFINQNHVFECTFKHTFDFYGRGLIKMFLIHMYNVKKYSHYTLSGKDIVSYQITNQELYEQIINKDYVFLTLVHDHKIETYNSRIVSFLDSRRALQKPTWVFAQHKIDSSDFTDVYSYEVRDYLNNNFLQKLIVQ